MSRIEKQGKELNRSRATFLLIHTFILALLCSPLFNLQTNNIFDWTIEFIDRVMVTNETIKSATLMRIQIFVFAFLMVLNEMNIMLRYILH